MARRPRALLLAALGLAAGGCIQNRLSVEIFTQLHGDGTCTRRIEYRLERVDTDQGASRVAIPPERNPLLRLHRFPSGEPWRISQDRQLGLEVVTVEAEGLPTANAVEGDYSRARSRRAQPARNSVSAFADVEHGRYEYQEVLRDPASPLAGWRMLSRLALKREDLFAHDFADALGERGAARPADLRRAYRDAFAGPFAGELAQIAGRPFFGPRERRELDDLVARLEDRQRELVERLAPLAAASPDDAASATEAAMQHLGDALLREVEESGLPLTTDDTKIRFHATLVMPLAILRANTCAAGDTAQWEFDEDDLFGRGFEMRALAVAR